MKNKDKILDLLMNASTYISGEKMSQLIGISRTAIWKNIKRLKEEGYQIDSVSNKGYRLIKEPNLLSKSQLLHALRDYGFTYVQLDESLDSTNLEAKRKAEQVSGNGCFVAREQTAGRGRRGRAWQSPKDSGCYVSLLLRLEIMPSEASMVTLIAGLALAKTLNRLYDVDARIKWPNDLVIQGKKVAGILTEMSAEIDAINYLVVGVGMNVSQESFPPELQEKATSLTLACTSKKFTFDRLEYIQLFASEFMGAMDMFLKTKDLAFMQEEYEQLCLNVKGDIRIEGQSHSFTGIGKGITKYGELLVLNTQGETIKVNSGEVSVRGIYGYV